jgi:hypothetical protein
MGAWTKVVTETLGLTALALFQGVRGDPTITVDQSRATRSRRSRRARSTNHEVRGC